MVCGPLLPCNNSTLPASMELMEEEEYKLQVLPLPDKALCDKKEYKVIRLENGLTALLISDRQKEHDDPGPYFPPTHNEEENESNDDEEDMEDDEDNEDEGEEDEEGEEEVEEEAEEETDEGIEDMPEVKDEKPVKKKIQTRYLASVRKASAASLTIGVGHLENPKEIQGLMHFLEHMVFMGSEKYPKENCFDNFVKKCGGCDNAHTDYENTTFYFEVQEMHFEKALDMFAQFFISPLMKKEAMQRERKSVHSEFQDSVDDDDCRREKLLANIANPDHPISFFNCGNEKTLQLNISDEELHSKLHHIR
ncbi:Insulin-degrading enzyme-like protein [Armadillidium nasatum]|uniref:Insulin-degrading enzyme-like protein n=1 Tax=Armadillidium nasatum TaxID=96803 RepID=A0A5N5TLE3_9CRUS|nr:Insulin-degrading enzyme-like protein [Armadillidium nasatum]